MSMNDITMAVFGYLPGAPPATTQFIDTLDGPIPAPAAAAQPPVDVVTAINNICVRKYGPQPQVRLDWANEIVDLLMVLGLDSSVEARQALAVELGYSGDMNDIETMDDWLHTEVMNELFEQSGQIPNEMN
jgi:hypothetical protein